MSRVDPRLSFASQNLQGLEFIPSSVSSLATTELDKPASDKVKSLSRVQHFVTLWTVSMGFSRQEYWSGLPFLHLIS